MAEAAAPVIVIGAGLAGLSAAVRLVSDGVPVALYEAAGQAGGRCRSFHDSVLDGRIDNGNHLMMSGNDEVLQYLDLIGARDALNGPDEAAYPFVDLASGARWTVRPGRGPLPFWLLDKSRRIPGTGLMDYAQMLRLARAKPHQSVADVVGGDGPLFERFWEPLALAALNMPPEKGQARLLWAVVRRTFLKGAAACRPLVARDGLGPCLVEPALDYLKAHGGDIRFNRRLRRIGRDGARVTSLKIGDDEIDARDRHIVLAVPPARVAQLLPETAVPADGETILNAHYRVEGLAPQPSPVIGLVGAHAHWIFLRGDIVSLTISAAGALAEKSEDALLPLLWSEVQTALDLGDKPYAAGRIIKEKRATIDQSPPSVARRPATDVGFDNLVLAGDWTDTGLPATIEGAVLSGRKAAALVRRRRGRQ